MMSGNKMDSAAAFCSCVGMMADNAARQQRKRMYYQMIEDSRQAQVSSAFENSRYVYKDTWMFPEVDGNLVYHTSWGSEDYSKAAATISDVLARFNLSCYLARVKQGATLTRFFLVPTGHTKAQSIVKLKDDIGIALSSSGVSVRIDSGYVVIEVPRENRSTVYFGDLAASKQFQDAGNTALAIGMDIDRNPVICDLRKAVHILIAGQTGSGKSVFMHSLVLSMLMKNTPYTLHMHIIDQKRVEFARYKNHPLCSVVTESDGAIKLLENMCVEMDRRYEVLELSGNRDIDSYNEAHADSPMRREVVVIDELGDLMETSKASVESNIVRLAQKARACGIHLIICTQYPVRNVVTGLIKQNLPTRICLSVKDGVASRVALDQVGAEDLLGNGDMLYLANGALNPVRLQGGFVTENEIGNIIDAVCVNIVSVQSPAAEPQAVSETFEFHEEPRSVSIAQYNRSQAIVDDSCSVTYGASLSVIDPNPQLRTGSTAVCGIISCICGAIGILTWFLWVPALVGVVFGVAGIAQRIEVKAVAIMGTVMSCVALMIPVLYYAYLLNIL